MTTKKSPSAGETAPGVKGRLGERASNSTRRALRKGKRPSDREYYRQRSMLPYGLWIERDTDALVLFNRYYVPIWRRSPDGKVTAVTGPWRYGKLWIDWKQQEYFYHDGCTPWHHPEVREFLEGILFDWFDVVVPEHTAKRRRK
jgi:hypothetical protein